MKMMRKVGKGQRGRGELTDAPHANLLSEVMCALPQCDTTHGHACHVTMASCKLSCTRLRPERRRVLTSAYLSAAAQVIPPDCSCADPATRV